MLSLMYFNFLIENHAVKYKAMMICPTKLNILQIPYRKSRGSIQGYDHNEKLLDIL